jgi:carboxyl-terminal processing protease
VQTGQQCSPESQLPGVGLVGLQLTETDPQLITAVVPNLPAAEAGIKAGDRIRRVDEKEVKDLSVAQLVELLRGQAGSKVTVEVEREGEANLLSFTLVRKAQ